MSTQEIAEIMANVLNKQFENIFEAKEFVEHAERIKKFIDENS